MWNKKSLKKLEKGWKRLKKLENVIRTKWNTICNKNHLNYRLCIFSFKNLCNYDMKILPYFQWKAIAFFRIEKNLSIFLHFFVKSFQIFAFFSLQNFLFVLKTFSVFLFFNGMENCWWFWILNERKISKMVYVKTLFIQNHFCRPF